MQKSNELERITKICDELYIALDIITAFVRLGLHNSTKQHELDLFELAIKEGEKAIKDYLQFNTK